MSEEVAASFDVIHFVGRFHPLFLHLPIGLVVAWLASEVVSMLKRQGTSLTSAVLAVMTAASAGAAVLTGKFLALREGGYNSDVLSEHFWLGIAFLVVCLLGSVSTCVAVRNEAAGWSKGSRILMMVALLVLFPGAHRGGALTHGSDFLSEYAPAFLKPLLGEEPETLPQASTDTVYGRAIQPLLMKYCGSCHGRGKGKGGFNIDLHEGLLRQIVPGNAAESPLVQSLRKPLTDDGHMPPEGYDQLTEKQIEAVERWINEGAEKNRIWDDDAAAAYDIAGNVAEDTGSAVHHFSDQQISAMEELMILGVDVLATAENHGLLQIDFTGLAEQAGHEELRLLQSLAGHIEALVLARCSKLPNGALGVLKGNQNLVSLDLRSCQASDGLLNGLEECRNLSRLVLSDNRLTAESVPLISSLSGLEMLYVWNSGFSAEDIQKLQVALPNCIIDTGQVPAVTRVKVEPPVIEEKRQDTANEKDDA